MTDNTMQENNNFETIINTWRRLSGEQQSDSNYLSMSGDSPENQLHKKQEEETGLLSTDRVRGPIATAASAGTGVITAHTGDPDATKEPEEKDELKERDNIDREDSHEDKNDDGAGDKNRSEADSDYLEHNDSSTNASKDSKSEKQALGDKVDSVYLRSPPPHKVRSTNTSVQDDEDCGIKCLYYTLQCCDCVLM